VKGAMKMKKRLLKIVALFSVIIGFCGCGSMIAIGELMSYHSARIVQERIDENRSEVIAYITSPSAKDSPEGFAPQYFNPYVGQLMMTQDHSYFTGTYFEVYVENVDTKEKFLLFNSDDFGGKYPAHQFRMSKNLPLGKYIFKELLWYKDNKDTPVPFTGEVVGFTIDKAKDIIYIGEYVIPDPDAPQIYKLSSEEDKQKLEKIPKRFAG
jgi:hypothetical protein